jgi:hypothetical protein
MDINENKISIFDNKFNIKDFQFNIELTADILSNAKELIGLTIKEIPFSFIRPRIMILVSENISKEHLNKITEIVYRNGKNKFRKVMFLDERLSIISVFDELNRCIYIVQVKNEIYGFAACAGQIITKGIMFGLDLPIDEIISQINHEIPNNIPNELNELKLKKIDFDYLWNNPKIILSLEPEYYYNKTKNMETMNFHNKYISDITHKGLIICAKKFYNKIL